MASSSSSSNAEAFVTLATKDDYAVGALVLAQSLRQVHTGKKLVVMISSQLSDQLKFVPLDISLTPLTLFVAEICYARTSTKWCPWKS